MGNSAVVRTLALSLTLVCILLLFLISPGEKSQQIGPSSQINVRPDVVLSGANRQLAQQISEELAEFLFDEAFGSRCIGLLMGTFEQAIDGNLELKIFDAVNSRGTAKFSGMAEGRSIADNSFAYFCDTSMSTSESDISKTASPSREMELELYYNPGPYNRLLAVYTTSDLRFMDASAGDSAERSAVIVATRQNDSAAWNWSAMPGIPFALILVSLIARDYFRQKKHTGVRRRSILDTVAN